MSVSQTIDITDLYRQILPTAMMVADDDGYISTQVSNSDKHPTLVNGKRLVLPTRQHQQTSGDGNTIIFHPLSENILRGESDVMAEFRTHVNQKLNYVIGCMALQLLDLAVCTDKHVKLSPKQAVYLSKVKNVDSKTLDILTNITKKMMLGNLKNSFIHMYIKRGGIMNQEKHSRVCNTTFPFYEELVKEVEPKQSIIISDVKLRKVDKESLIGLFEFILPNIAKQETYWGSSDSVVAPTIDALIKSVISIATRINELVAMYHGQIDDIEDLGYDLDYAFAFDNLESLISSIRMIPPQSGNEGSVPQGNQTTSVKPVEVRTAPVIQTHHASPVMTQPQVYQPVVQAPQYHHPQYYQQPVHHQQPQPGLVRTDKGIDVSSIFRANPQLVSYPNNNGMGGYVQGGQQMQRPPSWAVPQGPQYAPTGMLNNAMPQQYSVPPWQSVGSI